MDLVLMIYRTGSDSPNCIKEITFRKIFQLYTRISSKVVGMLVRARRHGLVTFKGEMLYQGQDDKVIIKLVKLPQEVIDIINEYSHSWPENNRK